MNDNIEIVFSFDTTGSMYPCLGQVKENIEQVVGTLFKEVPNLKIGLIAHGDYCDERTTYVTKSVDLTSDLFALTQFTRNVSRTHGGDFPECYELVLHKARTDFNWSLNSKKIFVMIGDATPHDKHYPDNSLKLDWNEEIRSLKDVGVTTYTIQCLSRGISRHFFETVANIGGGYHLELDQFKDVLNLISAIVYKQISDEKVAEYEAKVETSGRMTRSMDHNFSKLADRPRDAKGRFVAIKKDGDLVPVSPGRFQMLEIKEEKVIRDFVQEHDLVFAPGKGFYEFKKSEIIQGNKEIVLRDKKTGDMFSGEKARELLGIPYGTKKTISPRTANAVPYDVFIQSNSYNRKLKPGSHFLYEVDMDS